jgi:hypothetical protein
MYSGCELSYFFHKGTFLSVIFNQISLYMTLSLKMLKHLTDLAVFTIGNSDIFCYSNFIHLYHIPRGQLGRLKKHQFVNGKISTCRGKKYF